MEKKKALFHLEKEVDSEKQLFHPFQYLLPNIKVCLQSI